MAVGGRPDRQGAPEEDGVISRKRGHFTIGLVVGGADGDHLRRFVTAQFVARQGCARRAVPRARRHRVAAGDGHRHIDLFHRARRGNAKGVSRLSPPRFVPWAFAISAVLLIVEWALISAAPKVAAVLVYLHISGLGPILGSGFWLVATERFDPRTAKRKFGQIAGGGTFGGLLGGLLAERVAVISASARCCRCSPCSTGVRLAGPASGAGAGVPRAVRGVLARDLTPEPAWAGVRVLAEDAVPAASRAAGSARHDRRCADRLRLQSAGGRRRSEAAKAC